MTTARVGRTTEALAGAHVAARADAIAQHARLVVVPARIGEAARPPQLHLEFEGLGGLDRGGRVVPGQFDAARGNAGCAAIAVRREPEPEHGERALRHARRRPRERAAARPSSAGSSRSASPAWSCKAVKPETARAGPSSLAGRERTPQRRLTARHAARQRRTGCLRQAAAPHRNRPGGLPLSATSLARRRPRERAAWRRARRRGPRDKSAHYARFRRRPAGRPAASARAACARRSRSSA